MFRLDTSSNTVWDFDDFIDDRYPQRAAQWTPFQYQSAYAAKFRKYATSQDGADADPAAVLGIAAASAPPYHDAYKFSHPGGISQVVHSGYTKMNNSYRSWRLGYIDQKNVTNALKYEVNVSSPSSWTAYGPVTNTMSPLASTVFFYMFHKALTTSANYAETTDVTLTLSNTPTVMLGALNSAGTVFQLNCKIENQSNGQSFLLNGLVGLNQVIEINCLDFTVVEKDTGVNRLPMLSLPPGVVRHGWLELSPGDNEIFYRDDSVGGVEIDITYRSRWI
jgi:hypothetical protein